MREKILKLLEKNERSQSWLARHLQIDNVTLWKSMTGRRPFKETELMAMAYLFGVDVSYFKEEE